jgi:hypothetical protein
MDTSTVLHVSHSNFDWTTVETPSLLRDRSTGVHLSQTESDIVEEGRLMDPLLLLIDDVGPYGEAQRFESGQRRNRIVIGLFGLTVLVLLHQSPLSDGLGSRVRMGSGHNSPIHEFNTNLSRHSVPIETTNETNIPQVRRQSRALEFGNPTSSSIHCRITALNVMLSKKETTMAGYFSREEFVCIPIRSDNGQESDDYLPIVGDLENHVTIPQLQQAKKGALLAVIQKSERATGTLILANDSRAFRVLDDIPPNWAQYQQRTVRASAQGKQTLAIVRVSTKDSAPPMSLEAIRLHFAASRQSAAAQYKLCSFSKFQLQFKTGHDVLLPNSIQEFSSGSQLLDAAAATLSRELNISSMTDLADKVVFCLAPGTKGWVATAGVNFYRLVVNGDWYVISCWFARCISRSLHLQQTARLGACLSRLPCMSLGTQLDSFTVELAPLYTATNQATWYAHRW